MSNDLHCYEQIEEENIRELESSVLQYLDNWYTNNYSRGSMEGFLLNNEVDDLFKYPSSLDSWKCCGERWTRYSHVIDHIEHHHYLYRKDVVNNCADELLQGPAYKYACEKCDQKYFSFFAAITHFLRDHVEHQILCLQCCVLHTAEYYHEHINECNIVESYVRSNQPQN